MLRQPWITNTQSFDHRLPCRLQPGVNRGFAVTVLSVHNKKPIKERRMDWERDGVDKRIGVHSE